MSALTRDSERRHRRRLISGIATIAALWAISSFIVVPGERAETTLDVADHPFRLAAAYYDADAVTLPARRSTPLPYSKTEIPDFISTVFETVSMTGDYEMTVNATNVSQTFFSFADINVFINPPNFPTNWSGFDQDGNPLGCYGGEGSGFAGCFDQSVGPGNHYYVTVTGNTQDQTTQCSYEVNKNSGSGPMSDHTGPCTFSVQQQGDIILGVPPTLNNPATADVFNQYMFTIQNTGSTQASVTLEILAEPFSGGVNPLQVSGPGSSSCQFSSQGANELATCQLVIPPSSLNEYSYSIFTVGPGAFATSANLAVQSGENSDTENDSFFGSTSVFEYVDFVLSKFSQVENPTINSSYYYYIDVRNEGPSTARNVRLRDFYPTGFNYIESNLTWGAAMDMSSVVEFGPGEIPSGETERIYYWGDFGDDVFPCSQSERFNSAEVLYSNGVDLDESNNSVAVPIYLCESSFSGRTCYDENGNDMCDEGEEGVDNVRLYSSYFDVSSGSSGLYTVPSLPRWTYEIIVDPPTPFVGPDEPVSVVVNDQIITGIDIPLRIPGGDLHIEKFWDQDNDGERDQDEQGLDGIQFVLRSGGDIARDAVTAYMDMDQDEIIDPYSERGLIWWEDIPPGDYILEEVLPAGAVVTTHGSNQIPVSITTGQSIIIAIGNWWQEADWGDLPDPRTDLP
ncbi:MAG: DUF11 domain-containing protein, partial [Rhodothermales bacterium]|nr:DUF11 domain-containing protein [Rhodothermales bacterium]